jgi:hypothetical protein
LHLHNFAESAAEIHAENHEIMIDKRYAALIHNVAESMYFRLFEQYNKTQRQRQQYIQAQFPRGENARKQRAPGSVEVRVEVYVAVLYETLQGVGELVEYIIEVEVYKCVRDVLRLVEKYRHEGDAAQREESYSYNINRDEQYAVGYARERRAREKALQQLYRIPTDERDNKSEEREVEHKPQGYEK